jgi:hypothetical protein
MRKLLCAALLCAASSVHAQVLVARQGDDSVRLTGAECKSQLVLDRLDPSVAPHYRAASAVFQGQSYVACWRLVGNAAHLVYEDGDQGIIPATHLKPDASI